MPWCSCTSSGPEWKRLGHKVRACATATSPPDQAELERIWHVGARDHWKGGSVFPRKLGTFIRASADGSRELVVRQWGLIPFSAKTPKLAYQTNNARSEELAAKATFRDPWKRGQRCIIPAIWFEEPNWESSKNVWWSFRRADGPAVGPCRAVQHLDAHALMSRMHKSEVDKATKAPPPPEQQDKRSVVAIEVGDWDTWLRAPVDEAKRLISLPVETFNAGPELAG